MYICFHVDWTVTSVLWLVQCQSWLVAGKVGKCGGVRFAPRSGNRDLNNISRERQEGVSNSPFFFFVTRQQI